ncbi:DUF6745 domain-containing protein [Tolypothrix sp. NIES-4075]|uniref:DUF6745 domain-containing protein n=1 Tax=Tolypothrix sp. NIES-4075 TaxID=2005459 RepID=UPI00352E9466
MTECGWTFLFQDFCFLCNRPCHILLDDRNRLHAEHQPAIRFTDGFSIFVQHGESDNVQYFA